MVTVEIISESPHNILLPSPETYEFPPSIGDHVEITSEGKRVTLLVIRRKWITNNLLEITTQLVKA